MRKIVRKILTYCMIGTVALSCKYAISKANDVPINNLVISDENITKNLTTSVKSVYKDIAITQVSSFLNIREKASSNGKVVGKLYNNSVSKIIMRSGSWIKIKSGSVTGYVYSRYVVTGKKAEGLIQKIGQRYAVVNGQTDVMKEVNSEATVLLRLSSGERIKIKEELADWVEVSLEGNKLGYILSDNVKWVTEFKEAESIKQEKASSSKTQLLSSARTVKAQANSKASIRNKVVKYALRFKGNPYVWGGTSLTRGADCSGFTQSVFRNHGISIPRTSRTQATGGRVKSINSVEPGDLIFYTRNGTINHVGIYIGNGKIISASSATTGIRITYYKYRHPYKVVSYIG